MYRRARGTGKIPQVHFARNRLAEMVTANWKLYPVIRQNALRQSQSGLNKTASGLAVTYMQVGRLRTGRIGHAHVLITLCRGVRPIAQPCSKNE